MPWLFPWISRETPFISREMPFISRETSLISRETFDTYDRNLYVGVDRIREDMERADLQQNVACKATFSIALLRTADDRDAIWMENEDDRDAMWMENENEKVILDTEIPAHLPGMALMYASLFSRCPHSLHFKPPRITSCSSRISFTFLLLPFCLKLHSISYTKRM